ncbi:MAG: hypothetical protein Q9176_003604 [Flavoplaca citrina]
MWRNLCLYGSLFFLFAVSLRAYRFGPESAGNFGNITFEANYLWMSNTFPYPYIHNDSLRDQLAPRLYEPYRLTTVRQARSEAASLLLATVQELGKFTALVYRNGEVTDVAFTEITLLDHQLQKAIDAIGVLADANNRLKDDYSLIHVDAAQELEKGQRDMDHSVKIARQSWLLPIIGFLNARKEFSNTMKQVKQNLDEADIGLAALEKDQERINNILSIFLVWQVILQKIQKELYSQADDNDSRLWYLTDWAKEVILQRRQPSIRDFLNTGSRHYLVEVDLLKQRWEKLMTSTEDGEQGMEVQSAWCGQRLPLGS